MNSIIQYIPFWLLLFAFTGCKEKDVDALSGEETVTVTLNISASSNESRADRGYPDVDAYEGIRTLRVFVTDEAMTKIYYNEKTDVVENPDGITSSIVKHQITIPGIPVGNVTFYVIANEESLGVTYTTEEIRNNLENRKLEYIDDETPKHFPKKGSEIKELGLPMSGKKTFNITKDNKIVQMVVERAVTKLSLTVENATSGTIQLNNVAFGSFFGDRFYIFPEVNLDVPEEASYTSVAYDNVGLEVGPNETSPSLSLYLYPTYAWKAGQPTSPYTLSLVTGNYTYQAQVFAPGVNSFRRNTQVNIHARITTTVGMLINYAVQSWGSYTIDVPEFN